MKVKKVVKELNGHRLRTPTKIENIVLIIKNFGDRAKASGG